MNLFELFVKIGVDDKASPAMKNTQKNSETLANKIKVMSVQFEAAQKNVDKLSKEFNESVQKTGAASEETQELAVKLDKAEKEAKQLKDALDSYNSEIEESNRKTKELSEKLGKGLATAVKVVDAAIVGLGTAAINSYSQFEQLAGGAAKIFNEMSQTQILQDANNAYKELGLSANQYLAVINDVGATFAATIGDKAGYEAAKTGLKAISDYASGTGKNVDELSQKFTLITRSTSSYQSIADQFSGILPATSAGFLEQAQAAGILSDSYTQLTEVPIDEYQAAVSQMLQQGVADLGLANNTVLESETTISGSLAAMKAAADNFLVALVDDNADVGESFRVLATSVGTFLDNVIPKIWDFIGALGPVGPLLAGITAALGAFHAAVSISKVVGMAVAAFEAYRKANEGATVAQWLMNAAMNANPFVLVATLIAGVIAAIIALWNTNEGFREAVIKAWDGIKSAFSRAWNFVVDLWGQAGDFFAKIWSGIKKAFGSVADWFRNTFSKAWTAVKNVFSTGGKIFTGIKEGIEGVFKTVVNAIIRGINTVISVPFNAINKMLRTLRDVSILGLEPFSWIKEFSVPKIPELWRGGVLERGQIGLLEGSGAEAVVPLENNKKWISKVAKDMKEQLNGEGQTFGGNGIYIVQHIHSEAKTAADLMLQARYQAEQAVFLSV